MDTKALVNEAKIRFNHNVAKDYLKNKYKNKLLVAEQGGYWNITIELIAYLNTETTDTVILCDTLNNPIKVVRSDLLKVCTDTYNQVMQDWQKEWEALEKNR